MDLYHKANPPIRSACKTNGWPVGRLGIGDLHIQQPQQPPRFVSLPCVLNLT